MRLRCRTADGSDKVLVTAGRVFETAFYVDKSSRVNVMGKCELKKGMTLVTSRFDALQQLLQTIARTDTNIHTYLRSRRCEGFFLSDIESVITMQRRKLRQIQGDVEPTYERMTSFGSHGDEIAAMFRLTVMVERWRHRSPKDTKPRFTAIDKIYGLFRLCPTTRVSVSRVCIL